MNKKVSLYLSSLILMIALCAAPVSTHAATAVRCPTQPKIQKNINLIFFSFFKKEATVGAYIPKNLVLVDPLYTKNGSRCMTAQSYAAFLSMNAAITATTQKSLVISSAWRSTKTQQYFANARSAFAAVPGRSEHQLGTAIDVDIQGAHEDDYFGSSDVYQWMVVHAAEYGFVQSFNAEGEASTGIPNEPWHWRFVGPTIATKITTEKLDTSGYLYLRAELKKKVQ